jgi:hypothetical protein
MDPAAILDHQFRVAAYVVTWVIQLGYLTWLGIKWQSQKRDAERAGIDRPGNSSSRNSVSR